MRGRIGKDFNPIHFCGCRDRISIRKQPTLKGKIPMEKQALWQAYRLQQERIKSIPKWDKVALAGANMALQAYRKQLKEA